MTKSQINLMPKFFDRYINQVTENDIFEALDNSLNIIQNIDIQKLESIGDKIYEVNKWTVKDILQHIIDTERIMAYRALRFARNDKTILPGYDENLFAANVNTSKRNISDLINELSIVRQSSILLFKNLNSETIIHLGTCFEQQISALALGFVIVGHQQHHLNVIKEKYEVLI